MSRNLDLRLDRLEPLLLATTGSVRILWIEPDEDAVSIEARARAIGHRAGDVLYVISWGAPSPTTDARRCELEIG
jgi:hypothetical protein